MPASNISRTSADAKRHLLVSKKSLPVMPNATARRSFTAPRRVDLPSAPPNPRKYPDLDPRVNPADLAFALPPGAVGRYRSDPGF